MQRRISMLSLWLAVLLMAGACWAQQRGGELRFCLRAEPKTFNPLLISDEASDTIRYLTGGMLLRLNRHSQMMEPALAKSWKVIDGGRTISFKLREGIRFSDGTPFTAADVAYTVQQLMNPELHSPLGDTFRSGGAGEVKTKIEGDNAITITFPAVVAALERLFDPVAIMSARSPNKVKAVLGPFMVPHYPPAPSLFFPPNPTYS